jgi:hypothetical protein
LDQDGPPNQLDVTLRSAPLGAEERTQASSPRRAVDAGAWDPQRVYERADKLRNLLNEWDFIGVFDPDTNVDEYDCMLSPLLAKLAGGADGNEIRAYLDAEIRGHFGMSPELVGTLAMAEQLVAWWRAGGSDS